MSKQVIIASLVSAVGGAAIGGAITYLTVRKNFSERAQRDIEEVKESYRKLYDGKRVVSVYPESPVVVETPVGTVTQAQMDEARQFVKNLGYQVKAEEKDVVDENTLPSKEDVPDTVTSIYDQQPKKLPTEKAQEHILKRFNYSPEARREQHRPYLISEDEFHNTENEWTKASIVYYEDDGVLADERELPIDDIEYAVGEVHLEFFGVRSGDPNQVFVRNPQTSTDYEITRNTSSYTEIVLQEPKGADVLGTRVGREGTDG